VCPYDFGRRGWVGRVKSPPRPPVMPARESERLMNGPGCLPSIGALRRIRWPLQPRSRDLRTAFGDEEALDGDLSPPWVFRRTSPVFTGEADSRRTFRSRRLPTVSPADLRPDLGPRSLDPDRSFWSAFAELIRDQTSPTDFCNCVNTTCGQPNPSSSVLAGTEASTSFLFFSCHALSLAEAVTRGEPRTVRQP